MKASKMWFMRPEQVPLQQCRGIEHSDKNDMLLVRAAVELVARAFTQVRQAAIWERECMNVRLRLAVRTISFFG